MREDRMDIDGYKVTVIPPLGEDRFEIVVEDFEDVVVGMLASKSEVQALAQMLLAATR